ncbi:MAG TPA: ABC transporter substrate-binding protein [Candidatus Babeliales bacterium]|nr:ABC transporter substrate-binding protein [Candidatus Babeliales bacterium]
MKNGRAIITFSLIAIIVISAITLKKSLTRGQTGKKWTIGILQTASHPALDAARDGFITTLQQQLDDDIGFVVSNGQSSIGTIYAVAQQFHARQDIQAIYAIATPAAQAVASVEKEKPIIISAVTVIPELGVDFTQANVCGVSDMINVRAEIEAMHDLLPDVKTVGIIFSTAEINSVAVSKIMVTELERRGITPLIIGISSESDIEPAVISGLRKVDALIAPTDNAVANSIALIANLARKAEKPLIVSDNMLVKYGPLMARGVNYYESGAQAATVALQLLINHKKPYELPILGAESKSVFVNTETLDALKLVIPDTLAPDVVMIENQN